MKKVLIKNIEPKLYHIVKGLKVNGANKNMRGNCANLIGDCTGLRGDCSDLWGDCSNIMGNCSNIRGNCSYLRVDLDTSEITKEERKNGVNITDLILKENKTRKGK